MTDIIEVGSGKDIFCPVCENSIRTELIWLSDVMGARDNYKRKIVLSCDICGADVELYVTWGIFTAQVEGASMDGSKYGPDTLEEKRL